MRYAKLIDSAPVYAPNPIKYNGRRIANPQPALLLELGYKPVTEQPYPVNDPPEGYYWAPAWEELEDSIVQSWEAVPIGSEL